MEAREKAKEFLGIFKGNNEFAQIAVKQIIRSWSEDGNNRLDIGIIHYWNEVLCILRDIK